MTLPSKKLSIIIPSYNEEKCILMFTERMAQVEADMSKAYNLEFEYIFIDDGSTDATLKLLRQLSQKTPQLNFISFSRNFGKEAAILAGLKSATGDYLAIIDADLQDPPELLPQMYSAILTENFDCIATRRLNRKGEPFLRTVLTKIFYSLINKISDTQIIDGARDYRLMTRQVAEAVLSLSEYNRFSKGLFSWVGFSTKWIDFEYVPRAAGESKWSFAKLLWYSFDGILAFSVKPLAVSSFLGILFCIFAFLGILFLVVRWLLFGDPVAGWASTVTIVLFVGGVQLFCTGILGQYLAKLYMEGKGRPIYVVKERSND